MQTAFKKYELNTADFNTSDIVSESQVTTAIIGFGTCTIRWRRVGKLYFNLYFSNGGGLNVFFVSSSDTATQVASILGVTIDTTYDTVSYGAYVSEYISGAWTGNPPGNSNRTILGAFFIN